MPILRKESDFERLRLDGGLCYLCGQQLADDQRPSRDHVVNKRLFHPDHRQPLLILPTHPCCNANKSAYDEEISQLTGLLWRTPEGIERHSKRLGARSLVLDSPGQEPVIVLDGFPLWGIVKQWVQGFHAALYGEFLGSPGDFDLSGPMPGGDSEEELEIIPRWHRSVVGNIKCNSAVSRLDKVELGGSKVRYWCVWASRCPAPGEIEKGTCFFAIDAYGWSALGKTSRTPPHSCVGRYSFPIPTAATRCATIQLLHPNKEPLDAFGS